MNQISVYKCEHCDYSTTDMRECLTHEAGHYGLTLDEYDEWRSLHRTAADAGITVGYTRNEETSRLFDVAIENLVSFERTHSLTHKIKPRHFH